MGTNYYFMSRNKELIQTCFAEKSSLKVFRSWRCFTGSIKRIWRFMMNTRGSIHGKNILRRFMRYEQTLKKARLKFGVYEREYGETKYWNDPDYLFDWTEGEFM